MSTLYLVSTPIGNLKDITIRALETLFSVDTIYCEDTRETGVLMNAYSEQYGKYAPLVSYNDFNREKRIPEIQAALLAGKIVALVSDRGTPLISDPGFKLVSAVRELQKTSQEISIQSIPGANAVLTALQLSGFPPDKFFFVGFLPQKHNARKKLLESLPETTIVAFESPHRVEFALQDLMEVYGDIEVAVATELTKMYEQVLRAPISEVLKTYSQKGPKGEITLVWRM